MSGPARTTAVGSGGGASPPFRFYDNRQKYLAFVNTCNEKSAVARRAAHELSYLKPTPPALRIFDAGMGDATVLSWLMRSTYRAFPTVPGAARGSSRIVQPHFYAFGGVSATARWIQTIIDGNFDVKADSGKLALDA